GRPLLRPGLAAHAARPAAPAVQRLDLDAQVGDRGQQVVLLDLEGGGGGGGGPVDGGGGVVQAGVVLDHGHQGGVDLGDQGGDGLVLLGQAGQDRGGGGGGGGRGAERGGGVGG